VLPSGCGVPTLQTWLEVSGVAAPVQLWPVDDGSALQSSVVSAAQVSLPDVVVAEQAMPMPAIPTSEATWNTSLWIFVMVKDLLR
jgi:hypothetical protein